MHLRDKSIDLGINSGTHLSAPELLWLMRTKDHMFPPFLKKPLQWLRFLTREGQNPQTALMGGVKLYFFSPLMPISL